MSIERKKVPSKTYLARLAAPSFSFIPEGELHSDTILFINHEFTSDLADEQVFLESRDAFKNGSITVKPSPRAALEASAVALRAVAVKAAREAKAAEEALVAYDKANAPVKSPAAPAP